MLTPLGEKSRPATIGSMAIEITFLPTRMTMCQLPDCGQVDPAAPMTFLANTGKEISLACPTEAVPANAGKTDHGWLAFTIEGRLDFSLVGILAGISAALAGAGISIVALSTFDTDYVLIREARADDARAALAKAGYLVK